MSPNDVASGSTCPTCDARYPDAARFCAACGTDVRTDPTAGKRRSGRFAAHPSEPLLSFNVVSSLMPLASGTTPQTYRTALLAGMGLASVAAVLGFLPFAFAAAAVVVPVVFVLYLYDVNEWEDQPVPVVGATVAAAGVLALAFTTVWREAILDGPIVGRAKLGDVDIELGTLLVVALLVPIVSEVLKQLGPLWLASRPQFDDLIDGLTFGVASGAAYAALETIVLNHDLIFSGDVRIDSPDAGLWLSLIVLSGLVKPIVYGAATGIACAAYSGLGAGYDGFTPSYFRGFAEAVGINVAFQLGLYVTGTVEGSLGIVLGVLWGMVVAAVAIVRLRYLLHAALLEGALEAASRHSLPGNASQDIGFCSECEYPLLHGASFCSACGGSVRTASRQSRTANRTASGPNQEVSP